jgi:hypothetical protein
MDEMDEGMSVVDVAGASLTLLGAVVERYIKEGYCDPVMRKALISAEELAKYFQASVMENYEHHQDDDLVKGVNDLVTNLQVTIMEAGEVMNSIIRDHNLPVKENSFDIDTEHPNFHPEEHTDCNCLDKGEDED